MKKSAFLSIVFCLFSKNIHLGLTGNNQLEYLRAGDHADFEIIEAFDRGEVDDQTASLINTLNLMVPREPNDNNPIDFCHLVFEVLPYLLMKCVNIEAIGIFELTLFINDGEFNSEELTSSIKLCKNLKDLAIDVTAWKNLFSEEISDEICSMLKSLNLNSLELSISSFEKDKQQVRHFYFPWEEEDADELILNIFYSIPGSIEYLRVNGNIIAPSAEISFKKTKRKKPKPPDRKFKYFLKILKTFKNLKMISLPETEFDSLEPDQKQDLVGSIFKLPKVQCLFLKSKYNNSSKAISGAGFSRINSNDDNKILDYFFSETAKPIQEYLRSMLLIICDLEKKKQLKLSKLRLWVKDQSLKNQCLLWANKEKCHEKTFSPLRSNFTLDCWCFLPSPRRKI
jgi:hypothetical protein